MSESTPPERAQMRASDADRDAVAARLREALAEGRLDPDEHSERLDAVYNSKTLGELTPLLSDLPDASPTPTSSAPAVPNTGSPRPVYGAERVVDTRPTGRVSFALMSGSGRSGAWVVPPTFHAVAVMGGVEVDLREARFAQREVTIHASAWWGGIQIIVPDDVQVRVGGVGIMGGYGQESPSPSVTDPNAPLVNVVGAAIMAGVEVVYRPRRHQERGGAAGEIEQ
jgi:hypothetical protein